MCKSKSSFVEGAIFGALIGAALGILTAPFSGRETREKIKTKTKELSEIGLEELEEIKEEVTEKAQEAMDKVQDTVDKVVEEANKSIDKAKKRTFKGI